MKKTILLLLALVIASAFAYSECTNNLEGDSGNWTQEEWIQHLVYKDCINSNMINQLGINQSEQEFRILSLESWKTGLIDTIALIQTKLDSIVSLSTKPYFKYLSSPVRKSMVCGYGQDNHLSNFEDLGFNCTITYKNYSRGTERAYCKCNEKPKAMLGLNISVNNSVGNSSV